jgi:uncharacterized protein
MPLKSVQNHPSATTGFWKQYQSALSTQGLHHQYNQLLETGRLRNFEVTAAKLRGEEIDEKNEGWFFNDSDAYKWLEAAAYSIASYPSKTLQSQIDHIIDLIQNAQHGDGYIFTFVDNNEPQSKWKKLYALHEMYCMGHLIEAAVALAESAKDDRLVPIAKKIYDLLNQKFGEQGEEGYCGHPEIEIALIRLGNLLQDDGPKKLADRMIDLRGQRPSIFEKEILEHSSGHSLLMKDGKYDGAYAQDDLPIREQTQIVGHSVRAGYLFAAAAESAARRQDDTLKQALETIWSNLVNKRMYVTGGMGSTGKNEGFTHDFDLPNHQAYAETCAAISLAMWGKEMFLATLNAEYLDVVERTIFNGVLSGIDLSTTHYFYENPLESRRDHTRKPWFPCACCPPNIARLIGSIHNYAIFENEESIVLGFPIGGNYELKNGVTLKIESDYPISGKAKLSLHFPTARKAKVMIRIPDWCDEATIDLKGITFESEYENGFAAYEMEWKGDYTFDLDFEMVPRWIESHPNVIDNLGRIALQYGPSIYCLESSQIESIPQGVSVDVSQEPVQGSKRAPDGSTTWNVNGLRLRTDFPDGLYAEIQDPEVAEEELNFLPYRVWGQSGPTYMQVWVRSLS